MVAGAPILGTSSTAVTVVLVVTTEIGTHSNRKNRSQHVQASFVPSSPCVQASFVPSQCVSVDLELHSELNDERSLGAVHPRVLGACACRAVACAVGRVRLRAGEGDATAAPHTREAYVLFSTARTLQADAHAHSSTSMNFETAMGSRSRAESHAAKAKRHASAQRMRAYAPAWELDFKHANLTAATPTLLPYSRRASCILILSRLHGARLGARLGARCAGNRDERQVHRDRTGLPAAVAARRRRRTQGPALTKLSIDLESAWALEKELLLNELRMFPQGPKQSCRV
eukprot:6177012-Pleurochrysis_carterae.AAC.1